MKHRFYLLVSMLCMFCGALTLHGQWEHQFSGYSGPLKTGFFVSADTGFVGGRSTILRTTNGGLMWHPHVLSVQSDVSIAAIYFPTKQVGYAAGRIIYKTVDGGLTWDSVHVASEFYPSRKFTAIHFRNALEGYVVGDVINSTSDGGATWSDGPFDFSMPSITTSLVVNANGLGFQGGYISGTGLTYGIVAKTTDYGASWERSLWMDEVSRSFLIRTLCQSTDSIAWAGGWRPSFDGPFSRVQLLRTTNSGISWGSIDTRFQNAINTIAFFGENVGFIGDDEGGIYSTHDCGTTWMSDVVAAPRRSIKAIFGATVSSVFAVGDSGMILKRRLPTSVEVASNALSLSIYPNPTFGTAKLVVDLKDDAVSCDIAAVDMLGRIVFSTSAQSNAVTLDLSPLPRGMYTIVVRNGSEVRTVKLSLVPM